MKHQVLVGEDEWSQHVATQWQWSGVEYSRGDQPASLDPGPLRLSGGRAVPKMNVRQFLELLKNPGRSPQPALAQSEIRTEIVCQTAC